MINRHPMFDFTPVLTEADFERLREEGRKAYHAKHPCNPYNRRTALQGHTLWEQGYYEASAIARQEREEEEETAADREFMERADRLGYVRRGQDGN